jgi:hypothetical protein
MVSDESEGQDHLPLDDVPEVPADAFGAGPWGDDLADPFADPSSPDFFSAEIENVNASDWDIDADLIWGDDGGGAPIEDGDAGMGLDLPF